MLIEVVDGASPDIETHLGEVEDTLASLGCQDTPVIRVLNKIDAVDPTLWRGLKDRYDGLLVSAHDGDGLKVLLEQVERHLFRAEAEL